jgi:hypothetical protein
MKKVSRIVGRFVVLQAVEVGIEPVQFGAQVGAVLLVPDGGGGGVGVWTGASASQRARVSGPTRPGWCRPVAMVSSSAAGLLGGSAQGLVVSAAEPRANDAGLTPRWREPGSRMFSMKAAEIRPPEVVMWVDVGTQSSSPSLRRISSK